MECETWTYEFYGFVEGSLGLPHGGLAGLPRKLWYLVELLIQVGLDKLELRFIAGEALGASVRVKDIGHCGGKDAVMNGRLRSWCRQ